MPSPIHSGRTPGGATPVSLVGVTDEQLLLANPALVQERRVQGRLGLLATSLISFLGAVVLQASPLRTATHWTTTGALVALSAAGAVAYRASGEAREGAPDWMNAVGTFGIVVNLAAIAHVGVLSIVVVPLPLLIAYYAATDRQTWARVSVLLATVGYLGLLVLAHAGALDMRGAVIALQVHDRQQILRGGLFVVTVFVASHVVAKALRRTKVRAMAEIEAALRAIELRGQLLREVREDARRLLEAGQVGRLTGATVSEYSVRDVIGRGAFGEVYAAFRIDTGQKVALKVLYRHLKDDPHKVAQFLSEAAIASGVPGDHVVEVLGTGAASDGTPFIAMEFIEGPNLGAILRTRGRLELSEVTHLVRQVAEGLEVVHQKGFVHRDIKPENLVEGGHPAESVWKIADFGAAVSRDNEARGGEGPVGSPAYVSSEQATGGSVDARSDVCSLALVAFRCITGQPAFSGADPALILYRASRIMPVRPRDLVPLDEDVELVLALGIAKKRDLRLGSAREFAAALEQAAEGRLSAQLRHRGRAVLAETPWGSEVKILTQAVHAS